MKYVILFASIALAGISCKTSNSNTKSDIKFKIGDIEPELGYGFNSLSQKLIPSSSCLVGEQKPTLAQKAEINFTNQTSKEDIMKEFTLELKGTPRLNFVDVNIEQGMFTAVKSTKLMQNISYRAEVISGGEKLVNAKFSDDLTSRDANYILNSCGDEYVAQINKGGRIIVSLDFVFGDEESKKKWQTLGFINLSLANLNKKLLSRNSTSDINGVLNLKITQEGGDISALGNALTAALSATETT